jgi:hypothetical protein
MSVGFMGAPREIHECARINLKKINRRSGKRTPPSFYGFVRIGGDGGLLGVEPAALIVAMARCPGLPCGSRIKVLGGSFHRFIVSHTPLAETPACVRGAH